MDQTRKIKIAIQNKGRLRAPSLKFLRSIGLKFKSNDRDLLKCCENKNVEFLYVRNFDIPAYVEQNTCDFGIVGENVLLERESRLKIVKKLGFGKCSLIIAVPEKKDIKNISELEGERIATSYPNTLKNFLIKNGIKASVIKINGSVEIAPFLNLADAICDITQTGTTLKENGLKIIAKVLDSEAVVIKCPISSKIRWEDFEKSLIQ